jgi:putative ABC transport system ATP-binding protein
MESVIETRGLSKTYRLNGIAVQALQDVDLQVCRGEFVSVMGPSGCGKSTLLHLIGGLDRPTGGHVVVAGREMHQLNESQRAVLRRQTIGFVFQAYNLIPNLTAAENIELPGLLAGGRPRQVSARREALMEALGIADKPSVFPGELSGGQQQRVAIARALINRPAILLVDEPTGNLDSRTGAEVMGILNRFSAEGQTILLVTHDPKVAGYAERVVFMRDGHLVDEMELVVPGNGTAVLSKLVELEL